MTRMEGLHEDFITCPGCSHELSAEDACQHDDAMCQVCCNIEHAGLTRVSGFYPGLDEGSYRADRSALSASEAKTLLGKRPPADSNRDALDWGTAFHTLVLGVGPEPAFVDATDWRGKDARTERDRLREAGRPVLLAKQEGPLLAMREAVMAHPTARRILDAAPDREVSAYAEHPTGVMVRGRFDLMGPGLIGDLKTTQDADPARFGKTVADFMYHISAANYLDIANTLGADVAAFGLINIEKTPTPSGAYRVSVCELTADAVAVGRDLMHEACLRWIAAGKQVDLPGYGDGIHTIDLPRWTYAQHETTFQETTDQEDA